MQLVSSKRRILFGFASAVSTFISDVTNAIGMIHK